MNGKHGDDDAGACRPFTSGLAACVRVLGLSGCLSLGPDHAPPDPGLGEAWQQELRHGLQAGPVDLRTWWTAFGDADLAALIAAAIAGNLDLEAARARVLQAQAWRAVAAGERFPAVQTQGMAQRQRLSEDYLPGPVRRKPRAGCGQSDPRPSCPRRRLDQRRAALRCGRGAALSVASPPPVTLGCPRLKPTRVPVPRGRKSAA